MNWVLDKRYILRSWKDRLGGIVDKNTRNVHFLERDSYLLLLKCDGAHDINPEELPDKQQKFLDKIEQEGVIHPAGFLEFIRPEQSHHLYPAAYKESVHWSITGACNLKCRHCFMSAPHAKHGVPSHEQILSIADQLAECGIFQVGLTGGEPLIREDFLDIVSALSKRGIAVTTIYTNGWLVDEALLEKLEQYGQHPSFQLSYDGPGVHDFLRGVDGAEEKTLNALKLLSERGIPASVSMCIHRKNKDTLRETVRLLASYGVESLKVGAMMDLGEWTSPEVRDLQMTDQEMLEVIEEYIPFYFEDHAPVSIMLAGAFMYKKGADHWDIYYRRKCSPEEEKLSLACEVLELNFYIGADGMVTPCMGMGDCGYAASFPNLFNTPLKDIIAPDSDFSKLCKTSVAEVRNRNGKCRSCRFADRCTGGCRNAALIHSNDYYAPAEENCFFFENGWEERIKSSADGAFDKYLRK